MELNFCMVQTMISSYIPDYHIWPDRREMQRAAEDNDTTFEEVLVAYAKHMIENNVNDNGRAKRLLKKTRGRDYLKALEARMDMGVYVHPGIKEQK